MVTQKQGVYFIIHEVDKGETAYGIARRYHISNKDLRETNELSNDELRLGQLLQIPFIPEKATDSLKKDILVKNRHQVAKGETLYAIALHYNTPIQSLRDWNKLSSDELSIGQYLILVDSENESTTASIADLIEEDLIYIVQNGENLVEISSKFKISEDSIRSYNNLKNNRLKTGQKLNIPLVVSKEIDMASIGQVPNYIDTEYGSKILYYEEGGVTRCTEEGIVRKIASELTTTKYLALHRELPIGTIFQVINLMNNSAVYVRVVGKLQATGLNENVLLRITENTFMALGIRDEQGRVKIIYFK